jgi:hypothetical protein
MDYNFVLYRRSEIAIHVRCCAPRLSSFFAKQALRAPAHPLCRRYASLPVLRNDKTWVSYIKISDISAGPQVPMAVKGSKMSRGLLKKSFENAPFPRKKIPLTHFLNLRSINNRENIQESQPEK